MTDTPRGATAADWFHFDFVLGLGANLLPCVPAGDDVRVVAGSALQGKVGKIPSQFNANGEAHGLLEWQKRPILANEVKLWSADRRLNLCVRTGPISGVYAFDVDVEDQQTSDSIFNFIQGELSSELPARLRENSRKFLLMFRMEGPCKKRKIYLQSDRKGPAIELLADGQQFVAAGTHSSGVRYRWIPELPNEIPTLTMDQLNQLWEGLTQRYAVSGSAGGAVTSPSSIAPSLGDSISQTLTQISDRDWEQLIAALKFLLDKVPDNDTWSSIGYSLLSLQGSRPAEQLWYDFSRKAAGYEPGAPEAWWQAHRDQTPRSDYRHIFSIARQRGWGATSPPEVFKPTPDVDSSGGSCVRADGGEESTLLAPAPSQPVVRLSQGAYSQIVAQLEEIAKDEYFVYGKMLVRQSREHQDSKIIRDANQITLVNVSHADARRWFGDAAKFQKWAPAKSVWYDVDPSAEHINGMLEQSDWTRFRPLEAIARAPFLRSDGSVCDKPGYDPESRALLVFSAKFPTIPRHPSKADAISALNRIRGIFHQFPWAAPAAESGFLAHILSECGRLAIARCPMFFYNAPLAGTGKTLLQKAASIVAHGTVPALRPWVGNGDEVRKTVYASLLAGDRSLLFDNVPDGVKIRSAELCAAITADIWQDRKLGESEARGVPNRAVFSASGNNITPAGDLSRRSIIIRLDANTERLAQRRFDIEDLESYLLRERPQLLVDALTIISAYRHAPASETRTVNFPVTLPSFEQWSRLVREPLIWLGMPDPVETQEDGKEDLDNLSTVFALLSARFGAPGTYFTSVDIARAAGAVSDTGGELLNALHAAGCKEPNSPTAVGYWLRSNRDKVFGGMKLVVGTQNNVGMRWHFVKVED